MSRQRRSEDTVGFILDATEKVLASEGPRAVTMRHVADVAGVGVGTLYHHFADRAALLRAAERRAWSEEAAILLAHLPPAIDAENVDETLRRVVAFTVESVIRRMDSHGVTMDDPDMRAAMFEIWDQTAALMTAMLAPVAERMRRPDATTSLLLATEVLSLMSWAAAHRHRDSVARGEMQSELADMVARYLFIDGR